MSLLQAFFVSSPAVLRLPQAVRAVCMSVPSYLLTSKTNNMEHLKTRFMVLAFLLLWASGVGLCAQDVWNGSVADEFAGGSGTEADPYLISNGAELAKLAKLANDVNGVTGYSGKYFKLTADIVLNNTEGWETWNEKTENLNVWTPIGNSSCKFRGIFDGNGHTVKGVYINGNSSYCGLFGNVLSGTIKNLQVAESFIKGDDWVGGVVGYMFSGTLEGCFNSAKVSGSKKYVGGICGSGAGNFILKNCGNSGDVDGGSAGTCGGIAGYLESSSSSSEATNCFNYGNVEGDAICGRGNVKNSYYLEGSCEDAGDATGKDAAAFLSGEVCWLLNGESAENPVWFQRLGDGGDAYPVLNGDGNNTVYHGYYVCIETYANSELSSNPAAHEYDNGFCSVCGGCQEAVAASDGAYEIGNAGQLFWFASEVNGGDSFEGKKVRLVADICLNDTAGWKMWETSAPENLKEWTPIGTDYKNDFRGTFDGQHHTVIGVYINQPDKNNCGLFGYVRGGTIENLCVGAGFLNGGSRVGGVVGWLLGSSDAKANLSGCVNMAAIKGSGSNYGGIAGYAAYTDLSSCGNIGDVISSTGNCIGGIVGDCINSVVSRCFNIGRVVNEYGNSQYVGAIYGKSTYAGISNSYYQKGSCKYAGGATEKDEAAFLSGEVCWLLNEDGESAENPVWFQRLGDGGDAYPVLSGDGKNTVYRYTNCKNELTYSNSVPSGDGAHSYDNGICSVCGGYQEAVAASDGTYEIGNAGQLFWFASLVNGTLTDGTEQNTAANAVLTADISLENTAEWESIGNSSIVYTGEFDGQSHTISGMSISSAANCSGLFGNSTGIIRDFTVEGVISVVNDKVNKVGGALGSLGTASAGGTLSGVVSKVDITISGTGYDHIGGVVGSLPEDKEPLVENCVYNGKFTAADGTGCLSGIVGYIRSGTIRNCINLGELTISGSSAVSLGGILGYCNNEEVYIENNCNVGTVKSANTTHVGAIVGFNIDNQATVSNCFYLSGSADKGQGQLNTDASGTVVKTAYEFKSGAVAYLLQNGQTEQEWGQKIGVDGYPSPVYGADAKVYEYKLYRGSDGASVAYANDGMTIETGGGNNAVAVFEEEFTPAEGCNNVVVRSADGGNVCASLVLTDGADFYSPEAFTASRAEYSRTLSADSRWATLVLPFGVQSVVGGSLYDVDGVVAGDAGVDYLAAVSMESMPEACTPVLVKGDVAGGEISFVSEAPVQVAATDGAAPRKDLDDCIMTGSFAAIENLPEGSMFISRDMFWSVGTEVGVGMKAFRVYISVPAGNGAKQMRIIEGGTTDIEAALAGEVSEVDVYSVQGTVVRRGVERPHALDNLPAGIYIVGGEKVIKR